MLRKRKAPKAKKSMVEALMRDMQGSGPLWGHIQTKFGAVIKLVSWSVAPS
jgi:hypothetical protein